MPENNTRLTHTDGDGISMVDVGDKPLTARAARAEANVELGTDIAALLRKSNSLAKGPVFETAKLAGIAAAKRTWDLIPLCHTFPLDVVKVECDLCETSVRIVAEVSCRAATGVEMEAMTAAAVAALTIYDMCKAAGKGMVIGPIRLLEKRGCRSGHWRASDDSESNREV